MEQNEKAIKKNKVIELYTKGERCVRKLSQITGVPLTTVYRVIGKLKGINYNIPRGNGAGRKTILDAQDRECLVDILNRQPRISRKALGKELEKLTGKSIHNSTLNRELCRLRYQGHQSSLTNNPDLIMSVGAGSVDGDCSQNYMKYFNGKKGISMKSSVINSTGDSIIGDLHHSGSGGVSAAVMAAKCAKRELHEVSGSSFGSNGDSAKHHQTPFNKVIIYFNYDFD
jgi:transposase